MNVKDILNNADPNLIPDMARMIRVGSYLQGQANQCRRLVNMDAAGLGTYTQVPADGACDTFVLPDTGKAAIVLAAFDRGYGALTVAAFVKATTSHPATHEICVTPAGDLATLAADAITSMDVYYIPERGDVHEAVYPVASNVIVFPTWLTTRGVISMIECEVLAGGSIGKKKIARIADTVAAGEAKLTSVAKAGVTFYASEATRARVKLLITPDIQLHAGLETTV